MVRAMSGRERVLAREDDCRVKILNLTGTADAIVPTKLTHFDLKTGARRNYREQMAAYALGLMGAHFASDTMEKKAPRAGMTLKELADAAGR